MPRDELLVASIVRVDRVSGIVAGIVGDIGPTPLENVLTDKLINSHSKLTFSRSLHECTPYVR